MLDTPVLFIIFNRPDATKRVFEKIKEVKPRQLYIAADGPRANRIDDIDNCRKAREIVNVDWDCDVKTLFRDENLGCGLAVSSAISWFFSNVEYGIVLEDDCLPLPTFFMFCSELLIKYQHDTRVMHISGTNSMSTRSRDYSYTFSRLPGSWGWASWRRAWKMYDYDAAKFPSFKDSENIFCLFHNREMAAFQLNKYELGYKKVVDTWDYQWQFCVVSEGGLCISPSKNLIKNIGFGPEATHTFQEHELYRELIFSDLKFPLIHPPFIVPDCKMDYMIFEKFYKQKPLKIKSRLLSLMPSNLKRRIKKVLYKF